MYIGVDLGTTSVKLILVQSNGHVIRTVSKTFDLLIPQSSWTEQNPEIWYQQTIQGLLELIAGYESTIRAISFSGQMHGLVILDEKDQVLRNAILWNDQRTTSEVQYLNEHIGINKLQAETGNIAITGLTAPKLLWVKQNEPSIFNKISKIMLPKDYLAYRLSGIFATDVTDASGTLLYDVAQKQYSQFMLDVIGLDSSCYPLVMESSACIGHLQPEIASFLSLSSSVKIVIGAGDQAAGAVGVGIVESGECSISLGTSGVIFVASNQFKVDHKHFLQSYAHANGKYHMMSVMLNAAGALRWWSEDVLNRSDYTSFFEQLSHTPIEDTIFFLPYLSGERSPINDPYARGLLIGFGLEHQKTHIDRAIIEGVTFALKQSFSLIQDLGVDIRRIRLTGGGAKSQVWSQMIADIMGIEAVTIDIEEGPAFGAAILAMVGDGLFDTVESACKKLIHIHRHFVPDNPRSSQYNQKYERFIKIYPTVKALF